jgi:hypothetical protein
VRTLAHKKCVEEQAGRPADANTFVRALAKQALTIMESWDKNFHRPYFYTSLPYIGDQFITGDSPVVVIQMNDNPIWVPTSTPNLKTTPLVQILRDPSPDFWVSITPYVCVVIRRQDDGASQLPPQKVDPQFVRFLNDRVREQSKIFLLAKDRASLA